MQNILSSASKLVFIMMALAVIVALFFDKVDQKDFVGLASMAFVFYFTNKGEANQPFGGK